MPRHSGQPNGKPDHPNYHELPGQSRPGVALLSGFRYEHWSTAGLPEQQYNTNTIPIQCPSNLNTAPVQYQSSTATTPIHHGMYTNPRVVASPVHVGKSTSTVNAEYSPRSESYLHRLACPGLPGQAVRSAWTTQTSQATQEQLLSVKMRRTRARMRAPGGRSLRELKQQPPTSGGGALADTRWAAALGARHSGPTPRRRRRADRGPLGPAWRSGPTHSAKPEAALDTQRGCVSKRT